MKRKDKVKQSNNSAQNVSITESPRVSSASVYNWHAILSRAALFNEEPSSLIKSEIVFSRVPLVPEEIGADLQAEQLKGAVQLRKIEKR